MSRQHGFASIIVILFLFILGVLAIASCDARLASAIPIDHVNTPVVMPTHLSRSNL